MKLKNVQRINDTSPRMLEIISKTKRNYADQAVEVLSKWSLWYLLQEIAEGYTTWTNVISEFSDGPSVLAHKLWMIEDSLKNLSNIPTALKTELINLKWLINYISVEHGKSQLALSRTIDGIHWIRLKTRWSINIILWSKNDTEMQAALWN